MNQFIAEAPYGILIACAVIVSLYLANLFYDYNIPQYISRKIGHLGGAAGFILCPLLFTTFWWPLILTVGFTALLLYARLLHPTMWRGVGGSGRPQALAEIHFPATGIVLIGICWGLLDNPWLAIVPLLFMAGGDSITGLIRSRVYKREVKGLYGSIGMLPICLLFAYLFTPYWIGALGALVATLVEKYSPTNRFIDDNLLIPLVSALVMTVLWRICG